MEKIISDKSEEQEVKNTILAVIDDITHYLCHMQVTLEYDVELLVVGADGIPLESPEAICRHFIELVDRETTVDKRFDLFCSVVPYDQPVVSVKRKQYVGKPVRLSTLISTAVGWKQEEVYNIVMNHLFEMLIQVTGTDNEEYIKEKLKEVISARYVSEDNNGQHEHDEDCVCQQTPGTIVQAIIHFISGKIFTLKWDMVVFFKCDGHNLTCLELFHLILSHEEEGQELSLDMRCAGIPYGWTPKDTSGETPVRLTDLITHACTWTGGDDQQDTLFRHSSKILSVIVQDEDDDFQYQQLLACHHALHNTPLH